MLGVQFLQEPGCRPYARLFRGMAAGADEIAGNLSPPVLIQTTGAPSGAHPSTAGLNPLVSVHLKRSAYWSKICMNSLPNASVFIRL